ncbi:uncharacterized protein B4U79_14022 [Dinothrombium tinctorium]|uniref:Chitin-binding type-4 domain-containing protein n=1 Tax=Dinothrombium tinctorium TaxID=1965070 RepID=A0A443RR42_9ACAR|nr:uncharacterized protein B4U79_14022 [Dinothrombium tinctorium]
MHIESFLFVITLCALPPLINGHARMVEPPTRNTLWRFGFNTPPNYEDNQLFCGGIKVQWQDNGGKCGVCGDPYNGVRAHETGGLMARNITIRNYVPGSVVDVVIELIANHAGSDVKMNKKESDFVETEECFENLKLGNDSDHFALTGKEPRGMYGIAVKLPEKRECKHCILRWQWNAANNWGKCEDGKERVGCGPQETYRNCADVRISYDYGIRGGLRSL